jgi:ADP-dependent phosphofructokinase/glucokinase
MSKIKNDLMQPEPKGKRVISIEDTPELHVNDMDGIDNQRRWISEQLKSGDFTKKHIHTIAYIVALFKDYPESEKDVFDFACKLFKKYGK